MYPYLPSPYPSSATPSAAPYPSSMSIQGQLLEITVVGCTRLKDTEWISRQDPYVCLEYASTKYRTRTCTDGGKNPTFQEKFVFNLIEGLREISISVWNSNTLTFDDFIGNGKVQLHKVLSQGYDDAAWTIQSKSGKYAGDVTLIMHYANAQRPGARYAPTAPPYAPAAPPPAAAPYSVPPPAAAPYSVPPPAAALYPAAYPAPAYAPPAVLAAYPGYPPAPAATPYPSYPPTNPTYPTAGAYPPAGYPPSPYPAAQPYPSPTYPPGPYSTYPPPPY